MPSRMMTLPIVLALLAGVCPAQDPPAPAHPSPTTAPVCTTLPRAPTPTPLPIELWLEGGCYADASQPQLIELCRQMAGTVRAVHLVWYGRPLRTGGPYDVLDPRANLHALRAAVPMILKIVPWNQTGPCVGPLDRGWADYATVARWMLAETGGKEFGIYYEFTLHRYAYWYGGELPDWDKFESGLRGMPRGVNYLAYPASLGTATTSVQIQRMHDLILHLRRGLGRVTFLEYSLGRGPAEPPDFNWDQVSGYLGAGVTSTAALVITGSYAHAYPVAEARRLVLRGLAGERVIVYVNDDFVPGSAGWQHAREWLAELQRIRGPGL